MSDTHTHTSSSISHCLHTLACWDLHLPHLATHTQAHIFFKLAHILPSVQKQFTSVFGGSLPLLFSLLSSLLGKCLSVTVFVYLCLPFIFLSVFFSAPCSVFDTSSELSHKTSNKALHSPSAHSVRHKRSSEAITSLFFLSLCVSPGRPLRQTA